MSNRQTGTVKWFNDEKKASASSLLKVAVTTCSYTSKLSKATVSKSLKEGQTVSFVAEKGQKGYASCTSPRRVIFCRTKKTPVHVTGFFYGRNKKPEAISRS